MIATLVSLALYLIIVGVIIGLLLYLVSVAPIAEPFKGWLWFVVVAFAVVIIIYVLLGMIGGGASSFHVNMPSLR